MNPFANLNFDLLLAEIATAVGISLEVLLGFFRHRQAEQRREALFMNQLLEQWQIDFGSCIYSESGGRLNYQEPHDPFSFEQLDQRARERFKSQFKRFWALWEALKKTSKDSLDSLFQLYNKFDQCIAEMEDTWIKEMKKSGSIYYADTMKGYDEMPKYYYSNRLRFYALREISDYLSWVEEHKLNMKNKERKSGFVIGPRSDTHVMLNWGASGIVIGAKSELESLKIRLDNFVNDDEAKEIVQQIRETERKISDKRKEALESFERERKERIQEIKWKYRMLEGVQEGNP